MLKVEVEDSLQGCENKSEWMSAAEKDTTKRMAEKLMTMCDVAIIGAGPYGLSLAAHLLNRTVHLEPRGEGESHMGVQAGMHAASDPTIVPLYARI